MIRAIMEGVAFSLRDCMELIINAGIAATEVRISGGGARSRLWRQIFADVLNTRLQTVTSTDGAPYGAALLAGVGSGIFPTIESACDRAVRQASRTNPGSNADAYGQLHEIYQKSYAQNRSLFKSLSDIVSGDRPHHR
jgi:xylulokinase